MDNAGLQLYKFEPCYLTHGLEVGHHSKQGWKSNSVQYALLVLNKMPLGPASNLSLRLLKLKISMTTIGPSYNQAKVHAACAAPEWPNLGK